ncbi:MAG: hypothetical protein F4223_11495 [Rhodobacteraceae bacterium]|nr:hypothetical protein [Paracoccaceae bacterium]
MKPIVEINYADFNQGSKTKIKIKTKIHDEVCTFNIPMTEELMDSLESIKNQALKELVTELRKVADNIDPDNCSNSC